MNAPRSQYRVHAEVQRTDHAIASGDDAQAGYPLARRLNRIERVAASYRGRIDHRVSNGLLMTFETADAALLGACEMQQRCSGLPQASAHRQALRIGIHRGRIQQRSDDGSDNAGEIAAQLAFIDDAIVASDAVVADLNDELRRLASALEDPPVDLPMHRIDWHCEIPSTAYGGEALWASNHGISANGPYLVLHQGLKTLLLTQDNPAITVGRAPSNDLIVADIFVSRKHCRIERLADGIVLTDWSTNGTSVLPDDGEERQIKKESLALRGKGLLFFGRPCNGERRGGIRFETD